MRRPAYGFVCVWIVHAGAYDGAAAAVGGQMMIWWSALCARVLAAPLAMVLKGYVDRREMSL